MHLFHGFEAGGQYFAIQIVHFEEVDNLAHHMHAVGYDVVQSVDIRRDKRSAGLCRDQRLLLGENRRFGDLNTHLAEPHGGFDPSGEMGTLI